VSPFEQFCLQPAITMTLIAGVFSRTDSRPDAQLSTAVQSAISRNPSDRVEEFRNDRLSLFKVDVGAYGEPGIFRDSEAGSVSFLTGESLLQTTDPCEWRPRCTDLGILHRDLDRGSRQSLKTATGIFSIAHYRRASDTLTLLTDKLGHRSIYFWVDDQQVIFASTLRILEAIPNSRKSMDVLAIMEMNVYPRHTLGTRTPYYEIKRMRPGEILSFRNREIRSEFYWDYGNIAESSEPEETLLEDSHATFMSAVRRRLRKDKIVASTLSGGLDSRMVVSGLRALQARVHTINLHPVHNCQDRSFASMFSEAAGTVHSEVCMASWNSGQTFERTLSETWHKALEAQNESAERPQMIWTGDGGSVGTGHLHIEHDVADLVRKGRMREAFLSYHLGPVNSRIVQKSVASQLEKLMFDDFVEEFNAIRCPDRARALHVFLLKHHQRKDFVQHFDNIDLHRVEFQCPFYDSSFMESIVRVPFELSVAHRFYHKWMTLFPAYTTAVPWQTYADHEPCPLPSPPGLLTQWNHSVLSAVRAGRRKEMMDRAVVALASAKFPSPLVSKSLFRVAVWLERLRLRDCGTSIRSATNLCDYWQKCNGEYVLQNSLADVHARDPEYFERSPSTHFDEVTASQLAWR
jgi:asparagine synthase (glutamine-hydrolysing)